MWGGAGLTHRALVAHAGVVRSRCYKPRWCVFESSPRLAGQQRETMRMALKAPGILIFTLSIILSLAVLFTRVFGALWRANPESITITGSMDSGSRFARPE